MKTSQWFTISFLVLGYNIGIFSNAEEESKDVLSHHHVLIAQPQAKKQLQKEIRLLKEQEVGLHLLLFAGEDNDSQREAAHILINSNETYDSFWWRSSGASNNKEGGTYETMDDIITGLAIATRNHLITRSNKKQIYQNKENIVVGTNDFSKASSDCLIVVIENAETLSADSLKLVLGPIHAAYEKSTKKITLDHHSKSSHTTTSTASKVTSSLSFSSGVTKPTRYLEKATIFGSDVEIPSKIMFVLLFDSSSLVEPNKQHLNLHQETLLQYSKHSIDNEIDYVSNIREVIPKRLR